jgi:hypothetical protein
MYRLQIKWGFKKKHGRRVRMETQTLTVSHWSRKCWILDISQPYRPTWPVIAVAETLTIVWKNWSWQSLRAQSCGRQINVQYTGHAAEQLWGVRSIIGLRLQGSWNCFRDSETWGKYLLSIILIYLCLYISIFCKDFMRPGAPIDLHIKWPLLLSDLTKTVLFRHILVNLTRMKFNENLFRCQIIVFTCTRRQRWQASQISTTSFLK